jgi:structure-specific endonuclease subunit SLX1
VVGGPQQKPKAQNKSKVQKGPKASEKGTEDDKKKKTKRKPPPRRTRHSLKAHLEDLHLLLRSTYFKDWPLTLRFFAADVSQAWRGWCDRVDGIIPDHIKIIADGNCTDIFARHEERSSAVGSVQDIKVDYTPIRDYVEKGMFLLDDIKSSACKVCEAQYKENDLAVVCPIASCNSTAHLLCLSEKFLGTATDMDRFVPLAGKCPMCAQTVQWPSMMQELSIRTRGRDMTRAMVNRCERKSRKALKDTEGKTATVEKPIVTATMERDSSDEDFHDTDSLDDYWDKILDSDLESGANCPPQQDSKDSKVEVVIEDSELDDDESLG